VTTGGWPVQVNPTTPTALTSPVHDSGTGNVFVEDKGGYLYSVDPLGVVIQSGQLDFSTSNDTDGPGFVQGPIVDSAAGLVYVFAPSDGSGECAGGTADCAAVYQLAAAFIPEDTGLEAVVGNSTVEMAAPNPMYIGAFNSTYLSSVNATGDLYVCGNTGGPPTIYQVSIGNGVLGTVNAGPALATGTPPCSPVTDVLNPNASGGPTEWMFASAATGGISTACASAGCIFNFKDTPWLPSTVYAVGQEIVDSNFHLEFSTGGTSNVTPPFWSITTGGSTTDHTVTWLDLGPVSATPPAVWVKSHAYSKGAEILDTNGNIELVTTAGTSAAAAPTWSLTVGGTTGDGTAPHKITWTNVGPPATAALPSAGGTSGIIIDNTVSTILEPGTSQIYFSTLGSQACGTTGTGGCAVQASQSALK
jgi:hypothetical protein